MDGALDQPVAFPEAGGALLNASLTKIIVATLAGAAMIVSVVHDLVASIAEDSPWSFGDVGWLSNTERQVMFGALGD